MLRQLYDIDMIPNGVPLTLHVSQYDVGLTEFVFTPYVSVGSMDFSVVKQAYIEATKPDGYAVVHSCSVGDGTITYGLQEQLTAVSGRVYSKLVLKDAESNIVASKAIIWIVEKAGVTDDSVLSDSDLSGVETVIRSAINFEDAVPTSDETGEVIMIDDGIEGAPVESLVLNLEPHQSGSGDPSPDNVCPISGYDAVNVTRAGKNLLACRTTAQTINGVSFTPNLDTAGNVVSITVNGTNTGGVILYDVASSFQVQSGQYILSGAANGSGTNSYQLDIREGTVVIPNGADTGNSPTVTINGSVTYRVCIRVASGATVSNAVFKPMIRLATEADYTFEPYQGTTYPIHLYSTAGTVYGGSLDVKSGKLTVDRYCLHSTWSQYTSKAKVVLGSYERGAYDFADRTYLRDVSKASASICNVAPYKGSSDEFNSDKNMFFLDPDTTLNSTRIWVYMPVGTSEDTAIDVCYYFATPITYQLTPTEVTTLMGYNTIWMDAEGDISMSYKVRLGSYFDKLRNMIAPVEHSYIASTNYAVGAYLIVGTTLYKVTAAITTGTTITPGTNVVATTIAEQLLALA